MSDLSARTKMMQDFVLQAEQYGLDCDVLFDGPMHAKVAVVSDYPGEAEAKDPQKRPFVGKSGKLMWAALSKYGLTRINTWSSNAIKRQTSEAFPIHKDEVMKWSELLIWELSQLSELETVFVMGGSPLHALLAKNGVLNWRGSVLEDKLPNGKDGKYVVTFNPAFVLREPMMEPFFLMDCQKLDLVVRNKFKKHEIEEIINPSFKAAMKFLGDLTMAKKPVGTDIEHIRETYCYGFSNDPHQAMCINFRDGKQNRYSLSEEADLFLKIQGVFDSNKIVVQNGGHEIYWSWYKDGFKMRTWFDTMLAHHLLFPRLPHSLAFLVSQYTTHPFYKDDGDSWKEGNDIDMFWKYNCKDTALMIGAQQKLQKSLQERNLEEFFFNHVMRAQQHTAPATVHGMAIDTEVREYLVEAVGADVERLKKEFHRLVFDATQDPEYEPNPGSPKQMAELYFEVLGLKGKGKSTDKANREKMLVDKDTGPLAKEILTIVGKWSNEAKFSSTFVGAVKYKLGDDGRSRADWKQHGVSRAPGRLSSSQTIDGQGMNMQNQPVRARSLYVSDPGMEFAYFDLKQAEAVIVAYRANIPKWKEQFERMRRDPEFDTHRALASEMYKIPYDTIPKADWLDANGRSEKDPLCDSNTLQPTKRYVGKRSRHGLNYRMMMFKLAEVTKLPFHMAMQAFFLYHKITPELKMWWVQEEMNFRKDHVLFNAYGRPLKIIQRLPAPGAKTDDDVMDAIVAFYPQSTVGDKVVETWFKSEEDDKWPNDARVCLDVHDNLVALASPKTLKTALAVMKKYAESPIMVTDCYGKKTEPVYLQAEMKKSYPTRFVVKEGRVLFEEDKKGLHRWSHMKDIRL